MRYGLVVLALAGLLSMSSEVQARGCLRGAAVGRCRRPFRPPSHLGRHRRMCDGSSCSQSAAKHGCRPGTLNHGLDRGRFLDRSHRLEQQSLTRSTEEDITCVIYRSWP